jgi:hypothetical protein
VQDLAQNATSLLEAVMAVELSPALPDYGIVARGMTTASVTIKWQTRDLQNKRCISRRFKIGTTPPLWQDYPLDQTLLKREELPPGTAFELEVYDDIDLPVDLNDANFRGRNRLDKNYFLAVAVNAVHSTNLIVNPGGPLVGGTFYARRVLMKPSVPSGEIERRIVSASPPPPTAAVWLEVGEKEPLRDGFGNPIKIPEPAAVAFSDARPNKTSHFVEATSREMTPGTNYNALIRVVNGDGAIQTFLEKFTTKRRRVTGQWTDLIIHDDSDADGPIEGVDHGEITTWFQFYTGKSPLQLASEFTFRDDISDKSGMNTRDLRPKNFMFGSPLMGGARARCYFSTEASDDDGWGPTDRSNSFIIEFDTPFGSVREEVLDAPFASSGDDDGLLYTVKGVYSVTYT